MLQKSVVAAVAAKILASHFRFWEMEFCLLGVAGLLSMLWLVWKITANWPYNWLDDDNLLAPLGASLLRGLLGDGSGSIRGICSDKTTFGPLLSSTAPAFSVI